MWLSGLRQVFALLEGLSASRLCPRQPGHIEIRKSSPGIDTQHVCCAIPPHLSNLMKQRDNCLKAATTLIQEGTSIVVGEYSNYSIQYPPRLLYCTCSFQHEAINYVQKRYATHACRVRRITLIFHSFAIHCPSIARYAMHAYSMSS